MVEWRFGESAEDGEQWLQHPDLMYAYLEYRTSNQGWRRLMVATRGWILGHLEDVKPDISPYPRWALVPTMLIVPDERGDKLRAAVGAVIQQGGFDSYSTPV
jgi:hypothetical protein